MTYYGAKDMAESWRTVRKNTIQVAEEIPADQYNFKAAPDTMSVAELLAHLATATYWAQTLHFSERKTAVAMEDFGWYMSEAGKAAAALTTKDGIIGALCAHGEEFAAKLESASDAFLAERVELPMGSKTRFEMLLSVKEHEMHHRAQLFLIQRMIGIVPHLTRARQQRAQAQATQAQATT
ncbi:MAG: DinB family protein [Vicinamibacterales bacterium]